MRILAVDDNKDVLFSLKMLLKNDYDFISETNPDKIFDYLHSKEIDLILLDMNFSKDNSSGEEGFDYLEKILQIEPDMVVVFITAYGDMEKAIKAIKYGATDFITKPWDNNKLLATINSSLKLRKNKLEKKKLKLQQRELSHELDSPFKNIIGKSNAMKKIFKTVQKVAATDANILILGENGTGKELIARAIHRNSNRKDDVFISVDLGTLNKNLFESELFGHKKGAFTDAGNDRTGRFQVASGGTLFLDEIGNLSATLQAKLLTVLEDRVITPVGSNKIIPIDVRLICATNENLNKMVKEKLLRQDLLYRINTIEINLPPLRERNDDILLLADYFLKKNKTKYKKPNLELSKPAKEKLLRYHWPGNVRELQNIMERAVILCDNSDYLNEDDFVFKEAGKTYLGVKSFNLNKVEKEVIDRVLEKYNRNISKASEILGISRAALYRRIDKYGI